MRRCTPCINTDKKERKGKSEHGVAISQRGPWFDSFGTQHICATYDQLVRASALSLEHGAVTGLDLAGGGGILDVAVLAGHAVGAGNTRLAAAHVVLLGAVGVAGAAESLLVAHVALGAERIARLFFATAHVGLGVVRRSCFGAALRVSGHGRQARLHAKGTGTRDGIGMSWLWLNVACCQGSDSAEEQLFRAQAAEAPHHPVRPRAAPPPVAQTR